MNRDMNRYQSVKTADANDALTSEELATLHQLINKVDRFRIAAGRTKMEALVIESDWPEYELVWRLLELRVDTGADPRATGLDLVHDMQVALHCLDEDFQGEWDSALVQPRWENAEPYHAVQSHGGDLELVALDGSRQSSSLADYLEAVCPHNLRLLLVQHQCGYKDGVVHGIHIAANAVMATSDDIAAGGFKGFFAQQLLALARKNSQAQAERDGL